MIVTDVPTLLRHTAYRKVDVDEFLDPDATYWSRFDPEVGYVPKNVRMQDGAGGAWSTYTYEPSGCRRVINHADRPCRVHVYGDSFTQCQQVSDGESWEEYLAAHLGEPIRNFGVGGHSVFTACLRAKRTEATDVKAEYVVLNIFDDDSLRNLDALRWIRTQAHLPRRTGPAQMMNGVPWPYLRIDPGTGKFVEHPTVAPTVEAMRALADPDHFVRCFKDDQIVNLFVLREGGEIESRHRQDLERLAEILDLKLDLRTPGKRPADAERLHVTYALKSTEYLLDQMQQWAARERRRFRVILCYGRTNSGRAIEGHPRFDQAIVDHLTRAGIPFIDTWPRRFE